MADRGGDRIHRRLWYRYRGLRRDIFNRIRLFESLGSFPAILFPKGFVDSILRFTIVLSRLSM